MVAGTESHAERERERNEGFQRQVDTSFFLLKVSKYSNCISITWELLEMKILGSYPRHTVSQTLGCGAHKSNFEQVLYKLRNCSSLTKIW